MVKKIFYLLSVLVLFSCKSTLDKQYEKQGLVKESAYFFKNNLADIKNNNSTTSYGSIVGASVENYQIDRSYFPSKGQNFRQRYLIVHYTVSNNEQSVKILTQKEVSAHYLIKDTNDDKIYQLVDENKRAYHAGFSFWRNDKNLNDNSIGIEIVNPGFVTLEGKRVFTAFPEHQFKKVATLIKDLVQRYNIAPFRVLGHSDIAPGRKQDPGPLFPWQRLYKEYGVGMWYDEFTKNEFLQQDYLSAFEDDSLKTQLIKEIQQNFKTLGYKIEITSALDWQTKVVVEAFQFHFRPQNFSGDLDNETIAILKALVKKYS